MFSGVATSLISDSMDRLCGTHALKPMHGEGQLVGRALPIKVAPGDNLYIHLALRQVQAGDVLVIDGGGSVDRALIGEIMMSVARMRGAVGYVIDGAVRDVTAFSEQRFPCFARGVTHKGPYKNGPGVIGEPVAIDGVVVHAGDIVVGDSDGVVFVPQARAERVSGLARAKLRDEQAILAGIARGVYDDSWIDARLAS
ncbi:methyltransferase [Candidimonas nitroreducens]|uniref:Putative 4-hydroxy-4-methyl-2-oxoglutarate aldolase n=2 Tax=Candidimonas nitroreducens TaxID=683354 RepID=A0A225M5C2_9BURK|nr:methyltransferase [Candidimonas nitroreducens]